MICAARIAALFLIPTACLAAGPARPAKESARGAVTTVAGTLRSADAARGVIAIRKADGSAAEFAMDPGETLIFKGIRTLDPDELVEGMQLEIDYHDAPGGGIPRAGWIEVKRTGETQQP